MNAQKLRTSSPFGFGSDAPNVANATLSQSTETAKTATTSLDDVAPKIVFFPRLQLASLCGISGSTLDRYRNDLIEAQVPKFEWQFYGGGYDRTSAECVWQYTQLIKMMRVAIAKQMISSHMEDFWRNYAQKNR
ncbi:hypothetical protein [Dendronalium sp. ChiSLP03b]|uniref:hypothetical protein n=1 Tax=Dendronalium sp. ChiSLP03b TaxID=3075381 RepID=UPI00391DD0F1